MKVKPKLYLNGSPQTAEEGSLAFARNMKIDNDGNLVSDYGYENIESLQDYNIVGHVVGLDNKIYLFTDKEEQIKTWTRAFSNQDIRIVGELKGLTDSEVLTNVCVDTITSETSVNIDKGKYAEGKVYI